MFLQYILSTTRWQYNLHLTSCASLVVVMIKEKKCHSRAGTWYCYKTYCSIYSKPIQNGQASAEQKKPNVSHRYFKFSNSSTKKKK